jgi:hypothetical protein
VILIVLVAGLIGPEPSVTPLLVNAMFPVVPLGTLAVTVTELPNMLGPEVVTVIVGVVLFTVCIKVALAVLLLESPLYVAVIVSVPAGKVDVVTVAIPLDKTGEPKMVDPAVKVTVPVTFAGSVAVKVTDWLVTEGLTEDESVTAGDALLTDCVVDPLAELLVASPL